MISISCFYNHYNYKPLNFTFIRYESYVRAYINSKVVVLTYEQLVSNVKLFQMYKLSLLCTDDSSKAYKPIEDNPLGEYGVYTQRYWKHFEFTTEHTFVIFPRSNYKKPKNPVNMIEPKRASSEKKVRKFMKLFNSNIGGQVKEPDVLYAEYLETELKDVLKYISELSNYIKRYEEHEKRIYLLSSVLHSCGHDVYKYVKGMM
jgi:hypothetical protein